MSKTLIVGAESFQFPENRESPGWGEESSAWAEAVTKSLEEVMGPGDLSQKTSTIDNGVTSPKRDILGFFIDPAIVRAAVCEYSVHRKTSSTERVEVGQLFIMYKSGINGANSGFEIVQVGGGFAGVTFSITSNGQVQYTSVGLDGENHIGKITFRARALKQ